MPLLLPHIVMEYLNIPICWWTNHIFEYTLERAARANLWTLHSRRLFGYKSVNSLRSNYYCIYASERVWKFVCTIFLLLLTHKGFNIILINLIYFIIIIIYHFNLILINKAIIIKYVKYWIFLRIFHIYIHEQ